MSNTSYEGIDSGRFHNPRGKQPISRFKLLLYLFIFFAVLIFMFAILSQPLGILNDVLGDAYPEGDEFNTGRETNSNMQFLISMALGAAVVIGIIFLFAFYGFKNLGGDKPGSFG